MEKGMPKKVHPADLATHEAMLRASHFTSTIQKDRRYITFEWPTLREARAAARMMPAAFQVNRGAIVYAVTPEKMTFMVPSNMADPNHEELDMGALTKLAAKLGGNAESAVMANAAAEISKAASKPDNLEIPESLKISAEDRKAGWAKMKPVAASAPAKPIAPVKLPKLIWKNGTARTKHAVYSTDASTGKVKVIATTASGETVVCKNEQPDMARHLAAAHERKLIDGGAPAYNPKATKADDKESAMRKTKPTTKSKARGAVKAKSTSAKSSGGERHRYDWNSAEEKANKGIMPSKPDFSAPTHERFRPLLAEVHKAATGDGKAADKIAALKKIKIAPISSSPKAVKRYRDLCVKALSATPAKKAG
jgi:hypothetical protein